MLRYVVFMLPVAVVSVALLATADSALSLSTLERDLLAVTVLFAGLLFGEHYGPPRPSQSSQVSAGR